MKIIDLFNKIANGEDVPKKIRYRNKIWEYNIKNQDYHNENDTTNFLFSHLFDYFRTSDFINDEVGIIEEPKKIEKLKAKYTSQVGKLELANKINELIDEVNKLKEDDK